MFLIPLVLGSNIIPRPERSSVDEDAGCYGNCTWFGQMMHSSDITHTQSIARLYNDKNLHSYTAVIRLSINLCEPA